jgi:hypothetical protein
MANPRPPAAVLADLVEAEKMIREARARYSHAYDLAYSSGSGGNLSGVHGDLTYSRPTEAAALSEARDRTRGQVARAGREAKRMVDAAHEMHSALVQAMPGSDPYQPVWQPGVKDGIATRAERVQSAHRQRERMRRGDM